jgi:hypothetical protein
MDNSQIVFENFLRAQSKFLEEAKWFEGERRHSDPTEKFILETITESSKSFRHQWEVSKCKDCAISWKCGNTLKINCTIFIPYR